MKYPISIKESCLKGNPKFYLAYLENPWKDRLLYIGEGDDSYLYFYSPRSELEQLVRILLNNAPEKKQFENSNS